MHSLLREARARAQHTFEKASHARQTWSNVPGARRPHQDTRVTSAESQTTAACQVFRRPAAGQLRPKAGHQEVALQAAQAHRRDEVKAPDGRVRAEIVRIGHVHREMFSSFYGEIIGIRYIENR